MDDPAVLGYKLNMFLNIRNLQALLLVSAGAWAQDPCVTLLTKALPFGQVLQEDNELRRGGIIVHDKIELRAYFRSPVYLDGVHAFLVVREPDGRVALMLVNRHPTEEAILNGQIATHRTLRNEYLALNNGREPIVIAAGEGLINPMGELVAFINQASSYKHGNDSIEPLALAMKYFGLYVESFTVVAQFELNNPNPRYGHKFAEQLSHRSSVIIRSHPELYRSFRTLSRYIGRELVHAQFFIQGQAGHGLYVKYRRTLAGKAVFTLRDLLRNNGTFSALDELLSHIQVLSLREQKQQFASENETYELALKEVKRLIDEINLAAYISLVD